MKLYFLIFLTFVMAGCAAPDIPNLDNQKLEQGGVLPIDQIDDLNKSFKITPNLNESNFDLNISDENDTMPSLLPKSNLVKSIDFFKQLEISAKHKKASLKHSRIDQLNTFFNSWFKYQKDEITYRSKDYWASFHEMMQAGFVGDCEDFTFGKIQMATLFGIPKNDIFLGYTKDGTHIFPIFCDGKDYWISDTVGRLRTIPEYIKLYPDMRVYSFGEIWTSKDALFTSRRNNKTLDKILGITAANRSSALNPKKIPALSIP